jgi:type IV secretory pathway VirB3-like protein
MSRRIHVDRIQIQSYNKIAKLYSSPEILLKEKKIICTAWWEIKILIEWVLEVVTLWGNIVSFLCIWIRSFLYMFVIPVVFYISTGFAGCSVDRRISYGIRKLARTPRVIKKKKTYWMCLFYFCYIVINYYIKKDL